jgi:hypothetical protein
MDDYEGDEDNYTMAQKTTMRINLFNEILQAGWELNKDFAVQLLRYKPENAHFKDLSAAMSFTVENNRNDVTKNQTLSQGGEGKFKKINVIIESLS